jgi:hypothetical protein
MQTYLMHLYSYSSSSCNSALIGYSSQAIDIASDICARYICHRVVRRWQADAIALVSLALVSSR